MSVRFEVVVYLANAGEMTVPIECNPNQIGRKVRDLVELNCTAQSLVVTMNGKEVMSSMKRTSTGCAGRCISGNRA